MAPQRTVRRAQVGYSVCSQADSGSSGGNTRMTIEHRAMAQKTAMQG